MPVNHIKIFDYWVRHGKIPLLDKIGGPLIKEAGTTIPNRRIQIITLSVVVFLYWASLYLYVPTLPVYVSAKVNSLVMVGTILSMYGLWQFIFRLPVGISSDAVGVRKPFIIIFMTIIAAGALILNYSENSTGLLLGRALTGVGAGAWVPLVVLFTSLFPNNQAVRATGLLTLLTASGRMVATSTSGTLHTIGGYSLAFHLAALAAGLAILLVFFVPETRQQKKSTGLHRIISIISRREVLIPSVLNALLHYADWSATFTFTPLLAKQFGASDQFLGFLTTANLVVVFCGSLGLSIIGNRWKMTRVLIVGFTLISAGLVGLATANSLLFVVISQLFIGFGFGLCYPTLMAASINKVVETERTTAMGLHQSLYASGMFIGPWLSGIIASSFGTSWMFILTTLAVLLIFLVSLSKWRNE